MISQNLTTAKPGDFCLTPLADYVEKARKQEAEVAGSSFSLVDEVATARGSLQVFLTLLNQNITRFNKLAEKNPRDKELPNILSTLMMLSDKYIEVSKKFGGLAKLGVEIESVKASRLDAVQMLYILSQIPDLIAVFVESAISNVVEEIKTSLEKSQALEGVVVNQLQKEIPFFGKPAPLKIASHVNSVVENLQEHLEKVNVPHDKEVLSESDTASGVTEEQIQEMLNSVPHVVDEG